MPTSEPPAATGRPAFLVAAAALGLTIVAAAGSLRIYQSLHSLETQVQALSDRVSLIEEKNRRPDQPQPVTPPSPQPSTAQADINVLTDRVADLEKRVAALPAKSPAEAPGLNSRVEALEAKLKDSKGKLMADGELVKSIQRVGRLEDKLKMGSGELVADGEIAKAIQKVVILENKLKDGKGNLLPDNAISAAIRQVNLTKEDVSAITRRLGPP